ncbi:TIGR03086 family metal-binding protein [Gordonia shandongensis]|uniref:TIGR03086 family metal-binding protein n=1 Tax=Gordonia shandongensis TaxID=376351 RepID=UPI00042A5108|nr:TIGR03086 family metal-binding protein [Gordonia shandongensis]
MSWNALETYDRGIDFFTEVVHGIPDGRWRSSSPCAGWTALDVLGHVGEATAMGSRILRGGELEFEPHHPPSAALDGPPRDWWDAVAADARDALTDVGDLDRVVDSPMGPRTVRDGLSFPAVDLFLHGWDLGAAAGRAVRFPEPAIEFIRALFASIPDEVTRRPSVFGAAVDAPADADATDQVIAFSGRDPRWTSPST